MLFLIIGNTCISRVHVTQRPELNESLMEGRHQCCLTKFLLSQQGQTILRNKHTVLTLWLR
jgi:hypothetical protein